MNKQELIENCTIEELADKVVQKETIINQIDSILERIFGVTRGMYITPNDFEEMLKEKIESGKTISDFLPAEPIKVADALINAKGEYECNAIERAFSGTDKRTYYMYDTSELRQIAEHLLVYCNANMEG